MSGTELRLHCGGKPVSRDELAEFPVPVQTKTYMPVSHLELVEKIDGIARDLLHRELVRESFGVAREGQQMFAVLTYANGGNPCPECKGEGQVFEEYQAGAQMSIPCQVCNGSGRLQEDMGLSIGIRNSYDKSMSIGVALGARVFVCDNLAISGEIRIVRKHTAGVWKAIEDMAIATLYRHRPAWEELQDDVQELKRRKVTLERGWQIMGTFIGKDVLTPRQIPVAYRNWKEPAFEMFQERNAWSLYNSVNQALKTSPVNEIMERHRALHANILNLT
jgi:hypothetical protein